MLIDTGKSGISVQPQFCRVETGVGNKHYFTKRKKCDLCYGGGGGGGGGGQQKPGHIIRPR